MLAALVLTAVALFVLQSPDPVASSPEIGSSTTGTDGAGAPATSARPPSEEEVVVPSLQPTTAPEQPDSPPAREPSPLDPPEQSPARVRVVEGAAGKPCTPLTSQSDYGAYPLARCTIWKASEGALHGETLGRGPKDVTCQRQLDRDNPVFRSGQTNSWWVWTTSDDGTWDWYPETAVAQGAPDQPINGIARCQDGS